MSTYVITGTLTPDATGAYVAVGTYGGEPAYTNGTYWRWWDGLMYLISSPKGYMLSEYWQEVGTISPITANPMNGADGVATVTLATWTITTSAGTGGTISPATGSVTDGADQLYTITASAGYSINAVSIDGTSIGAATSYQFTNITAAHTVAATFTASSGPWHIPERKTEHAFHDLLTALTTLSGLQIMTRFENAELAEPYCQIMCENASADIVREKISGNWLVDVKFVIKSHYSRAVDALTHDNYVGRISDALMVEDLADDLNLLGVADFTALLWTPKDRTNRIEDHSEITELTGTLKMMPS